MSKDLLAAAIVLSLLLTLAAEERTMQTKSVRVADIGESVMLIGRLGQPLGQTMTIRGTWSLPKEVVKDYSPRFTVTSVNDQPLNTPVEFNLAQLKLLTVEGRQVSLPRKDWDALDSVEWRLSAYETGYVALTPDEYGERDPVFPIAGKPYYTEAFTSTLVAVRIQP